MRILWQKRQSNYSIFSISKTKLLVCYCVCLSIIFPISSLRAQNPEGIRPQVVEHAAEVDKLTQYVLTDMIKVQWHLDVTWDGTDFLTRILLENEINELATLADVMDSVDHYRKLMESRYEKILQIKDITLAERKLFHQSIYDFQQLGSAIKALHELSEIQFSSFVFFNSKDRSLKIDPAQATLRQQLEKSIVGMSGNYKNPLFFEVFAYAFIKNYEWHDGAKLFNNREQVLILDRALGMYFEQALSRRTIGAFEKKVLNLIRQEPGFKGLSRVLSFASLIHRDPNSTKEQALQLLGEIQALPLNYTLDELLNAKKEMQFFKEVLKLHSVEMIDWKRDYDKYQDIELKNLERDAEELIKKQKHDLYLANLPVPQLLFATKSGDMVTMDSDGNVKVTKEGAEDFLIPYLKDIDFIKPEVSLVNGFLLIYYPAAELAFQYQLKNRTYLRSYFPQEKILQKLWNQQQKAKCEGSF